MKPVHRVHLTIDKTEVLDTSCSFVQVKSIADCSSLEHSAILLTCVKQLLVLKTYFGSFFERQLKTGFTEHLSPFLFIPAYLQQFRCNHLFSIRLENSVHHDPIKKKKNKQGKKY